MMQVFIDVAATQKPKSLEGESKMLAIDEMGQKEIKSLLNEVGYGHLGCVCDGHPYVVPMRYRFEDPDLYILTTEGMKTTCIDANPAVCLQVEEVNDTISL
jgi:uncharacterized protein